MNNPLSRLIGTWKGNQGVDIAPKPDEDENNPYYETLIIEALDAEIENAEEQELVALRYNQIVREKANDKISHSEVGYWIWDKKKNAVMNSFTIPRGVCILASGSFASSEEELTIQVAANIEDTSCSIAQSDFMMQKAKTKSFKREVKVVGDTLSYTQEMVLDIYGRLFDHTETNVLTKVQ